MLRACPLQCATVSVGKGMKLEKLVLAGPCWQGLGPQLTLLVDLLH